MHAQEKRWLWIAVRVLFTALLLVLVVRMIHLEDTYRIRVDAGKKSEEYIERKDVTEARNEGANITLVYSDGQTSTFAATDVTVREGFISLFDRGNKWLYLALLPSLVIPFLFQALKWWMLLRGHGFELTFRRVFLVTYAGAFFNNFLAGTMGGDITKAIMSASGEERKAAVVGTVILDRLIGIGVMIVIGAVCLTPNLGHFQDKSIALIVYGLLGGMIIAYALYFNPILRGWLANRLPFRKTRGELDGIFRSAKEKKGLVAAVAGISVPSQVSSMLIVFGLAHVLHLENVTVWTFLILMPIIFIVTALPISVGGWGVQEGAYAYFFGTFAGMDPNEAVALSVLYKLSLILISVPGGILFALTGSTQREKTELTE